VLLSETVRIALIGGGRIAQVAHLPAIEKADGVELVAISDPSPKVAQAIACRYGVATAYTTAEEVWEDPIVEAVLVAAPDRFHHDLATAALAAGKHVLIEKPLASTVEQCRGLVAQVADSGLKLQVGAMKRHDAGLQYARRFIVESLGEARTFNAWYRIGDLRPGIEATLFPRVFAEEQARWQEAAFKADQQRYLLATHGSHIFDTVRFLLGDVASITARHRSYGRDQAWTVLVTTTGGAIGTVTITVDVPGVSAEGIEVFGATGWVHVDTHFPFYRRASTVRGYHNSHVIEPTLTDGDAYERQIEAFARAIREDSAPTPDVTDGLAVVVLIDATAAAAASGQAVTL
jgi:predicted dehydrogenase